MEQSISPYILNDITQMLTAVGVILTAINAIAARRKLNKVDKKIDVAAIKTDEAKAAAIVAKDTAETTAATVAEAHAATIEKIDEVRTIVENGGKK